MRSNVVRAAPVISLRWPGAGRMRAPTSTCHQCPHLVARAHSIPPPRAPHPSSLATPDGIPSLPDTRREPQDRNRPRVAVLERPLSGGSMAVTTQGVPKCLAEKSLLRWKPQLPLNGIEARRRRPDDHRLAPYSGSAVRPGLSRPARVRTQRHHCDTFARLGYCAASNASRAFTSSALSGWAVSPAAPGSGASIVYTRARCRRAWANSLASCS
jgi:hypothetical protein